jgi:LacI family transcriptional regulator
VRRRVGLVVDDLRSRVGSELIDELHGALARAGHQTVLLADPDVGPGAGRPDFGDDLDGLIFLSARSWSRIPAEVATRRPVVLLDEDVDGAELDRVLADDRAGGRVAVSHLVALGHRRIGLLSGPSDLSSARERERGFREGLRAAGVPWDDALRREGAYAHRFGSQGCTELLALERPPTALFCAHDVIAFGALDAARRRGVRVPHELSIVGCDDSLPAGWAALDLCTVGRPAAEMARTAVRMVLRRFDPATPVGPVHRVFPVRLVRRGTSGPPAAVAGSRAVRP